MVGLDQLRERTEEEFAEVLEEKLPNLPVAFIKVHPDSLFHPPTNWFDFQEYKELVKAEEERRKGEEDRLKATNSTALPKKVETYLQ